MTPSTTDPCHPRMPFERQRPLVAFERSTDRSQQIAAFPLPGRMVPEYEAPDIREVIERRRFKLPLRHRRHADSRTAHSCSFHIEGYAACLTGSAFSCSCPGRDTRQDQNRPSVSYNHRLLHLFQPNPATQPDALFSFFSATDSLPCPPNRLYN